MGNLKHSVLPNGNRQLSNVSLSEMRSKEEINKHVESFRSTKTNFSIWKPYTNYLSVAALNKKLV
jgi:DNA mismatch repair ATPase MutS